MQFHLNGFRPGDPAVADPVPDRATGSSEGLPEEVDVLIVGSGPAGLTLAAQLARFPGIRTRVVEQKAERLLRGQADGIACRTMEVFNALGFSERVLKEAYWVNETAFWKPDDDDPGIIVRSGRIQDTEDGLSEFPHVILNQARVHDFLLEAMWSSPTRLIPDYNRELIDLTIERSGEAGYPVTARIGRLDPGHEGEVELVRARFVAGCDGAHSTVRKTIGLEMKGDSSNRAWGVMDLLAVTDFPDIRLKTLIRSAGDGSLLIIPREGGYLVRVYIELDELAENERVASRNITVDHLIEAARRVFRPYRLDVREVVWWSVYEIGQRLCDRFDDLDPSGGGERIPSVFILGDASHTHSPKAGQGMNVAIRDAFNLGWKLATVLLGFGSSQILRTYSDERQAVARELIEFDRVFAEMMSMPPRSESRPDGIDPAEFQTYFVRQGRYTAGTTIQYGRSLLVAEPTHQALAEGFPIGRRFHSAPVIRLADARLVELGHTVEADGRWRLIVFAGPEDPTSAGSPIARLCEFLDTSADSPVRRHTPQDEDVDSVLDLRAVFQQDHRSLALDEMPRFLRPGKGRYRLTDYEKMFCSDHNGGKDVFDLRGVDRDRGCIVVVRPDQHVASVLPLDAHSELAAFFDRFMSRSIISSASRGA